MTSITPKEYREILLNRRRFVKLTGGAGIAALGIGLAGCTTTTAPTTMVTTTAATTAIETTTVVPTTAYFSPTCTMGVIPNSDNALLWVAIDQGYITEHFASATVNKAFGSGKASTDAVVAGSVQIGFSSYGSPIAAAAAGTPMKFLYNAMGTLTTIGSNQSNQILAARKDDTTVTSDPRTWVGKTVATNAAGNPTELGVKDLMYNAGITGALAPDPSILKVTATGSFPANVAALTSKSADLAGVVEPFWTQNMANLKEVSNWYSWMGAEAQITSWFTSDALLTAFPGIADAFIAAVDEAYDFWHAGGSNLDLYWKSIADGTGATLNDVKNSRQLKHYNYLMHDSIQKQGDQRVRFGLQAASIDACSKLIYSGAPSDC